MIRCQSVQILLTTEFNSADESRGVKVEKQPLLWRLAWEPSPQLESSETDSLVLYRFSHRGLFLYIESFVVIDRNTFTLKSKPHDVQIDDLFPPKSKVGCSDDPVTYDNQEMLHGCATWKMSVQKEWKREINKQKKKNTFTYSQSNIKKFINTSPTYKLPCVTLNTE